MPNNTPLLTPSRLAAFTLLDELRVRGGLGLVLGHPGTGKSTLLSHYAHTRPSARWTGPVLHYASETMNTPLAVVTSLLAAVGVAWRGGTRDGLRVLEADIPPGTMLVVDDAATLASHSLDLLRRLHERTQVRLVLAGPPELVPIRRRKCRALAHRVHVRLMLPDFTAPEVAALVKPHLRTADDAVAATLTACSGGNPYWAGEGLRLARMTAQAHHQRLSPQLLTQVFDTWAEGRGRCSA